MRFVVVHVHAVSVHLLPQAVAGSMDELRTVPGALDHLARRAVDLVSAQLAPRSGGAFHELDAGVAAISGRGKHLRVFLWHDLAGESHPGDVSKDCAGRRQLAPQVEQDNLVQADRPIQGRGRLVVRVAGVLLGRDNRGRIADEPLFCEPLHHRLLYLELVQSAPDALFDQLKRPIFDPVEPVRRRAMCRQRLSRPNRLEPLHEIPG